MSQFDVELKAGGKYFFDLVFRDDRHKPLDLTGVQAVSLRIRERRTTGAASLSVSMTVVNPTAPEGDADRGRATYLMTGAQSAALGPGEYEFEGKADWGDGSPVIAPGWGMRTMRINPAMST